MLVLAGQECGLDLCCVYQQHLCVTNESSVICAGFVLYCYRRRCKHIHTIITSLIIICSLRTCQPNHFEVVFVAAIDSALQEMQNI